MTEDLAVEATGAYRAGLFGRAELDEPSPCSATCRRRPPSDADGRGPAHAKMRLQSITHFEITRRPGPAWSNSVLSNNVAGNGGFGLKFFLSRALAFRIDVPITCSASSSSPEMMWS